jgi:hypothetical protein
MTYGPVHVPDSSTWGNPGSVVSEQAETRFHMFRNRPKRDSISRFGSDPRSDGRRFQEGRQQCPRTRAPSVEIEKAALRLVPRPRPRPPNEIFVFRQNQGIRSWDDLL